MILIILFNKTHAYITQNTETILMPAWYPTDAKEVRVFYCTALFIGQCEKYDLKITKFLSNCYLYILQMSLTLKTFGKLIRFNLRRNDQIASLAERKHNEKDVVEKLLKLKASDPCIYLYEDQISYAAINFCDEYGLVSSII